MKLRVLAAAATAVAAASLGPVTAGPAAAGTCGQYQYNEVDSTRISISVGATCNGSGGNLWIHIPISDGWQAIGSYQTGPGDWYETITYTCAGTNPNTFGFTYDGAFHTFTDYCGPLEP